MTAIYFLAPNARWQGRNLVGDAAVYGKLKTFIAGTLIPAITWSDPAGVNPNPVEIPLDAKGEANIYWGYNPDSPVLYYIELYDKNGALVYSQDNYPTVSTTNAQPAIPSDITNFVRNPQFTFWDNTTVYSPILQSTSQTDFFSDEWLFFRSNTTAPITISQQLFTLGQATVPANPISYLHYTCGDATGAGETYKRITQNYQSVQTLSGQIVSFAIWAKSSTGSSLNINIIQNFGTGGSPSADVTTNLLTVNLTNAWTRYTVSKLIPTISGTLGSNGDDKTILSLDLPLNTFSTSIDLCNVQLQPTSAITPFVIVSQENGFLQLKNFINSSLWKTGDIRTSLRPLADPGWILATDTTTIGNGASGATLASLSTYALFTMIWSGVSNTYAVIYDSAGVASVRGASAALDFAANKRLQITTSGARVLANLSGSGLTLGQTAGATLHSNTVLEMPAHIHRSFGGGNFIETSGVGPLGIGGGIDEVAASQNTASTGGGTAWDIRQLTIYYNVFIKL